MSQQNSGVLSPADENRIVSHAALALAPHGVRVNAIGPGYMATDMTIAIRDDERLGQAVLGDFQRQRAHEREQKVNIDRSDNPVSIHNPVAKQQLEVDENEYQRIGDAYDILQNKK